MCRRVMTLQMWRGVAALTLFMSVGACADGSPERPNILLVFTDDHASHAVSAYGSVINETPNIDRLAAEGMLFENAFVTNSICAPSRATILTGQYGHLNGVPTNYDTLHATTLTFPKLLQSAGYQTALIGKWHLKVYPEGFDHFEVLRGQGPYYNPILFSADDSVSYEGYTTDIITDRTLRWMQEERDGDRPFLLMYQHKAPHREWAPGPEQLNLFVDQEIPEPGTLFDDASGRTSAALTQEMTIAEHMSPRDMKFVAPANLTPDQLATWDAAYGPRNEAFEAAELEGDERTSWQYQRYIKDYLRSIASVDENLGRVLDYLDAEGLTENTVVVYMSDQGFFLGDHGWYDKRWMYEESLRTPLIVRWPASVNAGERNDALVQNLDIAQTFLDLADVSIPESMQGASLVPLLRGETPPDWRDAIYYQYFEYPGPHMVRRHYGIRTGTHKLIHYYEIGEWELFDLEADPDELRSVFGSPDYAEIQARLAMRLDSMRTHFAVPVVDPVPYER
ncbi:MAG: sulfatase [Gemmatimonadota bacterium]|nr:sulfatase [Gemmatimonadota bacterium]MDE3007118.1 sulfatase [Gemmatimonadota bacterium]MDE3014420.1 sulfatase [Gemmatimonadota bacterium]